MSCNVNIQLPDHIDEAVGDLMKRTTVPLATNIGNTLGDIWDLVFGGLSDKAKLTKMKRAVQFENDKIKLYEAILKNLGYIQENDLKEPDLQIVGQALEKSKYCLENDILRNMFSSLVTSSLMRSKENMIHPSFAEIITQLSPNDAAALLSFKDFEGKPLLKFDMRVACQEESYPILKNVWYSCTSVEELEKWQLITTSLERLGLIEISYSERLIEDEGYLQINVDILHTIMEEYIIPQIELDFEHLHLPHTIEHQKGVVQLTSFGKKFLQCVI